MLADGAPLTFAEVLQAWRTNESFCDFWAAALREIAYPAYCWETPPLTSASQLKPFECVFLDSPALAAATADPGPFAAHFHSSHSDGVAVFDSLGGDALLAAPCRSDQATDYEHLAAFVRTGSEQQVRKLWLVISEALLKRLSATPVWLSTAGLEVSWLHIRIDSRPKYYRHRLYADPEFWNAREAGDA